MVMIFASLYLAQVVRWLCNQRISRVVSIVLGLISFWVINASESYAQKCEVDSGFRGTKYDYRDNNRRTIHKFNQLPLEVRAELNTGLLARVGAGFFHRLTFAWGYAFDLDDTPRLTPSASLTEFADAYDLVFYFSDRANGLKGYYFKVMLDAKGKITDDVSLPDLASSPGKAGLISCKTAIAIANTLGFPGKRSSVRFDFNPETKSFIWIVTDPNPTTPDDEPLLLIIGRGTYRHVDIDANTGEVLRIYKQTIML